MCYVRSKAKEHGKGNQIEGKAAKGQKVVVVEDLISTGGSAITAVQALREAGCEVLGIVSIFTYELEKGSEHLRDADITSYSLTDYSTLIEVASEKGYIQPTEMDKLIEWQEKSSRVGKIRFYKRVLISRK